MKQLINYIEQFVKLTPKTIKAVQDLAEIETYPKNQHILEAGQYCNKIWFLKKGLIRKYYLYDGKEITSWIHAENETLTSLPAYAHKIPSEEFIQACENSELISITRQSSEKLVCFPEILTFTNILMEREFVNIDKHTKAMNQKDAKGKYDYLREIAPEIVKRAKLGYIASIVGVTQETLSRIRKR